MSTDGPLRPTSGVHHQSEIIRDSLSATGLTAAGRFRVAQASRIQWAAIEGWIQREGWDPGLADADVYFGQDPRAFFIGLLDGALVSALSVVNYGPRIAFLGNYLVVSEHRGRGIGLATWRVAILHAGDRAIGLEAIPEQVSTYRRAGFSGLYATIGFKGRIPDVRRTQLDPHVVPYLARHSAQISALDGRCFPQNRPTFADTWATAPGHRTLVRTRGTDVTGYGVIRPSTHGHRIGPLVADTEADAIALVDALIAPFPGSMVTVHTPEPNASARLMATSRGLTEVSRTTRMYTQQVRPTALTNCYAIGSLAYG